jgi:hypothetical protein
VVGEDGGALVVTAVELDVAGLVDVIEELFTVLVTRVVALVVELVLFEVLTAATLLEAPAPLAQTSCVWPISQAPLIVKLSNTNPEIAFKLAPVKALRSMV